MKIFRACRFNADARTSSNHAEENIIWDYESLTDLRDKIRTQKYPISIIELADTSNSFSKAVEFIKSYVMFAQNRPLRCSLQNL